MAQAALQQDAPGIGHNLELTEAERRALLINGLVDIEAHTADKDEAVANIRACRKRLVAHGFKPKLIDFALRLRKNDDEEEVEQRQREIEIARFLGHPIGTQVDLFDQPDRTPDVDKARQKGEIAGAAGETRQPPYAAGTAQEQAWLQGWSDGQTHLASAFKKLEAKETVSEDEEGDDE